MKNFNQGILRLNKFQGAEKKITLELDGIIYIDGSIEIRHLKQEDFTVI
ncbi:MAG: hypothetical protein FWF59_05845 [Turicibacter sp.]|nr:hypothetical protein [Turicibacter sp.]